jgi:hypothetical protein
MQENIVYEFHPKTGQEVPEGERVYCFTPSLTSAPGGGGWSTLGSGRFTLGKDPVSIVQEVG